TETPYFQPNPAPSAPFVTNRAYNDPERFDGGAWALRVVESEDIIVQNYQQTCLDTVNCQGQIVSIDNVSDISIYSLTTFGVTYQWSVNEQPIINNASNVNGFGPDCAAPTHSLHVGRATLRRVTKKPMDLFIDEGP
ncbi:hypothetical protein MPER_06188, partial [Moniliophthora perniciosa FA553]